MKVLSYPPINHNTMQSALANTKIEAEWLTSDQLRADGMKYEIRSGKIILYGLEQNPHPDDSLHGLQLQAVLVAVQHLFQIIVSAKKSMEGLV